MYIHSEKLLSLQQCHKEEERQLLLEFSIEQPFSILIPGANVQKARVKEMFVNIMCKAGRSGSCMLSRSGLYQSQSTASKKMRECSRGLRHLALRLIHPRSLTSSPYLSLYLPPHTQLQALHMESSKSIFDPICLPLHFFIS